MDYKAIEQIIKTAGESDLTYLEIETEGIHITMGKGEFTGVPKKTKAEVLETAAEKAVSEEVNFSVKEAIDSVKETITDSENVKVVTSPIVGTFYGAGSPEAEPFASVGKVVKKGQVLCIIEAMKLMNEIESEFDGEIVEVLAKDEQMIEYGQQLFKIKVN